MSSEQALDAQEWGRNWGFSPLTHPHVDGVLDVPPKRPHSACLVQLRGPEHCCARFAYRRGVDVIVGRLTLRGKHIAETRWSMLEKKGIKIQT
jgi:hypothetical protein